MPRFRLSAILLASLFCTGLVHAEDSYFGVDYMMTTYDEAGVPEFNPTAVALKFGKNMSPSMAIEGRVGFGMSDDSGEVCIGGFGCADVDLEIDSLMGAYVRGIAPLSERARFYGLLGMTRGEITVGAGGESFSETETDLSYGVGAEFLMGESTGLNLEYLLAIDKDGVEVSSLTVGLVFHY